MSLTAAGPHFDIRDIPFSHYGSWLALSPVTGNARHSDDVHLVSHRQGMHAIFRLRPLRPDGADAEVRVDEIGRAHV